MLGLRAISPVWEGREVFEDIWDQFYRCQLGGVKFATCV